MRRQRGRDSRSFRFLKSLLTREVGSDIRVSLAGSLVLAALESIADVSTQHRCGDAKRTTLLVEHAGTQWTQSRRCRPRHDGSRSSSRGAGQALRPCTRGEHQNLQFVALEVARGEQFSTRFKRLCRMNCTVLTNAETSQGRNDRGTSHPGRGLLTRTTMK